MTSSTNLKKWALGKDYQDGPWQGFSSPQFQDLLARTGDDGEQECKCCLNQTFIDKRVMRGVTVPCERRQVGGPHAHPLCLSPVP